MAAVWRLLRRNRVHVRVSGVCSTQGGGTCSPTTHNRCTVLYGYCNMKNSHMFPSAFSPLYCTYHSARRTRRRRKMTHTAAIESHQPRFHASICPQKKGGILHAAQETNNAVVVVVVVVATE